MATVIHSVPQSIFRDIGQVEQKNDIPSLENTATFDTVETSMLLSENPADTQNEHYKKVGGMHKKNILRRLVSRKKSTKDSDPVKQTKIRKLMNRLSIGKRSQGKKLSGSNTVVSIETPPPEEAQATIEEITKVESSKDVVTTSDAEPVDESKIETENLVSEEKDSDEITVLEPEVTEPELAKEVGPEILLSEIAGRTLEMPHEDNVETETGEIWEEVIPEKSPFHNESSDYVGLAMVSMLVGLLGSSLYQA